IAARREHRAASFGKGKLCAESRFREAQATGSAGATERRRRPSVELTSDVATKGPGASGSVEARALDEPGMDDGRAAGQVEKVRELDVIEAGSGEARGRPAHANERAAHERRDGTRERLQAADGISLGAGDDAR